MKPNTFRQRVSWLSRLVMLGLAWGGQVGLAHAASFSLTPTRLVLGPTTTSTIVTVTNHGGTAMRFQLTAFAWDQTETGQIALADTTDVVVYPTLVVIEPGESRRIRVAVTRPATAVERTYRLFVEELPDHTEAPSAAMGVQVRTRMGVPIFVQAARAQSQMSIGRVELRDGALWVRVSNSGSAHAVLQRLDVRGASASGAPAFNASVNGWYVLAGHEQVFRVPVTGTECLGIAEFTVAAEFEGGPPATSRARVNRLACGQ